MNLNRVVILAALAAIIGLASYWLGRSHGLWVPEPTKYIISDIFSLIVVPNERGECDAAVGFEHKHVVGTFVAEPIKRMICKEYYFTERPEAKYHDAAVVLVKLDTEEYHWVLESQLAVRLRN